MASLACGASAFSIRWFHIGYRSDGMHCMTIAPGTAVAYVALILVAMGGACLSMVAELRRSRKDSDRPPASHLAVWAASAGALVVTAAAWSPEFCF